MPIMLSPHAASSRLSDSLFSGEPSLGQPMDTASPRRLSDAEAGGPSLFGALERTSGSNLPSLSEQPAVPSVIGSILGSRDGVGGPASGGFGPGKYGLPEGFTGDVGKYLPGSHGSGGFGPGQNGMPDGFMGDLAKYLPGGHGGPGGSGAPGSAGMGGWGGAEGGGPAGFGDIGKYMPGGSRGADGKPGHPGSAPGGGFPGSGGGAPGVPGGLPAPGSTGPNSASGIAERHMKGYGTGKGEGEQTGRLIGHAVGGVIGAAVGSFVGSMFDAGKNAQAADKANADRQQSDGVGTLQKDVPIERIADPPKTDDKKGDKQPEGKPNPNQRPADDSTGGAGPRSSIYMPADDGSGGNSPRTNTGNMYLPADDSGGGGTPRSSIFRPADDSVDTGGPRSNTADVASRLNLNLAARR